MPAAGGEIRRDHSGGREAKRLLGGVSWMLLLRDGSGGKEKSSHLRDSYRGE